MSDSLEPMEDPLPALIAALDQALEMAPQMARMAWGYYEHFKDAGFADNQALYLTAVQMKEGPGPAP